LTNLLGKKKALIISVSEYKDTNLQNLDFCKNDGEAMYDVLTQIGYDIPSERKIVGQVHFHEFTNAMIDFFREDVNPFDTLLFYFSGHGYTDGYSDGFFCTSDIDIKMPDRKGIPFSGLTKQMDKSDSQRIIAILDCCYSGATLQSNIGRVMGPVEKEAKAVKDGNTALKKEFGQGQGRCILASSLSNMLSYGLEDKPYSAFTYYILEGLKGKKETVDEEGHVTPEKLSLYVSNELKKLQGKDFQKPVRHLSITDKLILAEHPELRSSQTLQEQQLEKQVLLKILKINDINELKKRIASLHGIELEKKIIHEKKKTLQISKYMVNKIEEKFVSVGKYKIRYLECGDSKENLILLHGLGSSADRWKKVMPYLCQKYHLIAPDIIGYGYSDKPTEDYVVKFFVKFLTDFMKTLKIEKTAMVGSNLGGLITAECAILQIKSIQKIILVAPFGIMKDSNPIFDAYAMSALYPDKETVKTTFGMMAGRDKSIDSDAVDNFLKIMRMQNAKMVFMSTILSLKRLPPITDRLPNITVPTLLIWGKDDLFIPIKYSKDFLSTIKNCQFVEMNNCGHMPYTEDPKKFSDIVLNFLQ